MTDVYKYQAAGNDYLVTEPRHTDFAVSPETTGCSTAGTAIGADGVLDGPLDDAPDRASQYLSAQYNSTVPAAPGADGLRMFALRLAERLHGGGALGGPVGGLLAAVVGLRGALWIAGLPSGATLVPIIPSPAGKLREMPTGPEDITV
ncbi:hypothetical protein RB628_40015 [Streptomyces sp. ADMS]|uniref:hypothetical protein n=1 Tax=Streptomyces sp. ADMS TaxID=3071415 RepID=UPI00296FC8C9|nr:hypothetical protein [Streptomyces sp. ADMS]MDW4911316.1 hypothetical protein [Streptomyces sp. ADMS]